MLVQNRNPYKIRMYKTNLTNTLRSSCSKMNDVSSKHKFTMVNKHSVQENELKRGEQI